jgi:hypothetical protein
LSNPGRETVRAIYKYPLYAPVNHIEMPAGAKLLHAHEQHKEPHIWMEVDLEQKATIRRVFHLIGTGSPFEATSKVSYVETVHVTPYVWHIYEEVL